VVNAPNPQLKLKPGLTANITIFTMEKTNVQTLSNKVFNFKPDIETLKKNGFTINENVAITKDLPENEKIVWQQVGKTISDKCVTIGDTDGINTEITANMTNADSIILEMKTTGTDVALPASTEKSPFMPQRPGSTKKSAEKN